MRTPRPSEADLRRRIPSVDQVLQDARLRAIEERFGRPVVLRHLRALLDEARVHAVEGEEVRLDALLTGLQAELARRIENGAQPSLVRVINATGVVVHTNLGRAPLSREAAERVALLASSYSNLEFDLARGERGDREVHAEIRLRAALGVEGSVVVNNCAAAVLLAVNTFAEGREVLVSRGELVEIGGSFRIPEILRKGGARLREVGTTNRTRLADYRAALTADTGMVLRVHRSNFEIVGFTEAPERDELVGLCRESAIPLVEDLGSGLLQAPHTALASEPTVAGCLKAGAEVVTFSGDKLLGGPQAGLAAGSRAAIDAMRRNPLYRALRVDKMTLAALEAVLSDHASGRAAERVPVLRMLRLRAEEIRVRAEALARQLKEEMPALVVEVTDGASAAGGGAAPLAQIPTVLVTLAHPKRAAHELAAALRAHRPPVIARVTEDRVVFDLRTVVPEDEAILTRALLAAAARD